MREQNYLDEDSFDEGESRLTQAQMEASAILRRVKATLSSSNKHFAGLMGHEPRGFSAKMDAEKEEHNSDDDLDEGWSSEDGGSQSVRIPEADIKAMQAKQVTIGRPLDFEQDGFER